MKPPHRRRRLPKRLPRPSPVLHLPPPGRLELPLKVFISFSHCDLSAKDLLCRHLSSLAQDGLIRLWDDRQLSPGRHWQQAIEGQLQQAQLVLLLVSCDYISSEHCTAEALSALKRFKTGACISVPIILRACDWRTRPWRKLNCLPTDGYPVWSGKWHSPDEAFTDVACRLRDLITNLIARKAA